MTAHLEDRNEYHQILVMKTQGSTKTELRLELERTAVFGLLFASY